MKEQGEKRPKLHMVHTKGIEKWSGNGALHPNDESTLAKFLSALANWVFRNGPHKEIDNLEDVSDVRPGERIYVGGTMDGTCPQDHAMAIKNAGGRPVLLKRLLWRPKRTVKYSRIPGEATPDDEQSDW